MMWHVGITGISMELDHQYCFQGVCLCAVQPSCCGASEASVFLMVTSTVDYCFF